MTLLVVTFLLISTGTAQEDNRHGKLFYVTSTTVTSILKTSTLCFTKESCDKKDPFDAPGEGTKMCATGCACAPITGVTCPNGVPAGTACNIPGSGGTGPACPAGCVAGPMSPIPDPCNSCTVTDSMANMMIPVCPGRKKKRAILESALSEEEGGNISPSPTSMSDIESSKEIASGEERAGKYYLYWITTTIRPTETKYTRTAMLDVNCTPMGFSYEMCPIMRGK